jgi:hypothetical protein
MDIWPSTAFLSWKPEIPREKTARLPLQEAKIRKVEKVNFP